MRKYSTDSIEYFAKFFFFHEEKILYARKYFFDLGNIFNSHFISSEKLDCYEWPKKSILLKKKSFHAPGEIFFFCFDDQPNKLITQYLSGIYFGHLSNRYSINLKNCMYHVSLRSGIITN